MWSIADQVSEEARSLLHCSRRPELALSLANPPAALKPAIANGKRTLGYPRQSARHRTAAKLDHPRAPSHGPNDSLDEAKAAFRARGTCTV